MARRFLCVVTAASLLVQPVWAFGPKGHGLVGEIADKLLAGKPEEAKIATLLEGVSLAEAAKIPDDIKSWNGQPKASLPWTMKPALRNDMLEFLLANSNPPGGHGHNPDHHSFHFTDISVSSNLKYDLHKTGAGKTDIVQMITFCIKVLEGTIPQPNARRITPRVAVVLLAHYLGDMHQPLHVGAAYFDPAGNLVDPDQATSFDQDKGGNDIEFKPHGSGETALHSFWDGNAVDAAVKQIKLTIPGASSGANLTAAEVNSHFVANPPPGAPLDAGVPLHELSVAWANEILPVSKQAHDRLKITPLSPPVHTGHFVFKWKAVEAPGTTSYTKFAGEVTEKSIHRAGWRLASLLERLL